MSNSIAPGSSADVNVKVTALTTNPNVPAQYKTVILKKNLVNGVNTLTQAMMNQSNIKYVIKYDFFIDTSTETTNPFIIPDNSILKFEGGSINNCYLLESDNIIIIDGKFEDCPIQCNGSIDIRNTYSHISANRSYGRQGNLICELQPNNVKVNVENCTFINDYEDGTYSDAIKLVADKSIDFNITSCYLQAARGIEDQGLANTYCSGIFANNKVIGGELGVSLVHYNGKKVINSNIVIANYTGIEPSNTCIVTNNKVEADTSLLMANSSYGNSDNIPYINGNQLNGKVHMEFQSIDTLNGVVFTDNHINGDIRFINLKNVSFKNNIIKNSKVVLSLITNTVFSNNEFNLADNTSPWAAGGFNNVEFVGNLFIVSENKNYTRIVCMISTGNHIVYKNNRVKQNLIPYVGTYNYAFNYTDINTTQYDDIQYIDNILEFYNLSTVESQNLWLVKIHNAIIKDSVFERNTIVKGLTDRNMGTTAQRPSLNCYKEVFGYYDITINKPIWSDKRGGWIDATGTSV